MLGGGPPGCSRVAGGPAEVGYPRHMSDLLAAPFSQRGGERPQDLLVPPRGGPDQQPGVVVLPIGDQKRNYIGQRLSVNSPRSPARIARYPRETGNGTRRGSRQRSMFRLSERVNGYLYYSSTSTWRPDRPTGGCGCLSPSVNESHARVSKHLRRFVMACLARQCRSPSPVRWRTGQTPTPLRCCWPRGATWRSNGPRR